MAESPENPGEVPSATPAGEPAVQAWLRAMLATGGQPADYRQFLRQAPSVEGRQVRLCGTGAFAPRALGRGRPDCVFFRQGADAGVIELRRPDGALAGFYSARPVAGEGQAGPAAMARGRFLNSEDFFLAGAAGEAVLVVGTSAEVTRTCRDELERSAGDGAGQGPRLYSPGDLKAVFDGTAAPTLFVVEAVPLRPTVGPTGGAGPDAEAAGAFLRAFEFLRVLLASYAREFAPGRDGSAQAGKELAIRLHEVACKAADAQAGLVVAASQALRRLPWARLLATYQDIADQLGQLPAALVPAGGAVDADAVATELIRLLERTDRARGKLAR